MLRHTIFAALIAGAFAMTECEKQASKPVMLGAFRPQCEESGKFARLQYHGSTGHRWCVDPETGVELLGTRATPTETTPDCDGMAGEGVYPNPTQCQQQAAQPPLIGAYRPQCEDDGSYTRLQCHGSTGHCWCVDKTSGLELLGTRSGPTEPRVDCTASTGAPIAASPCVTMATRRPRLIGAFVPQCLEDGSFSPMQCHGSTGHCWCVNTDGRELEGTRMHATAGRPDCSTTHKKTITTFSQHSTTLCEEQASAPPMPGAYRPQCTEDGAFASMQYHGSLGHRWCVDPKTGLELEGTRRGPTDPSPDCEHTRQLPYQEMTPCELRSAQPLLLGAYRPQCEDDGSYSPMQCHGSTGHCWCVNKESGAELEGTRKGPSEAMPDCDTDASTPRDLTDCEQLASRDTHFVGAFVPQCLEDGSFSPMQCHGSTGHCWCVNDEGHELEGTRRSPTEARPDCSLALQASPDQSPAFEDNPKTDECMRYCEIQYPEMERAGFGGWQILGQYTCKKGCEAAAQLHPCGLSQAMSEDVCYTPGDSCINFCRDINPVNPAYAYPCFLGVYYQIHHSVIGLDADRSPFGPADCLARPALTPCEEQASAPAMPGAYRPQCTEDGAFASMQYHGSTGHRWCVDPTTGVELDGSRRTPTDANPDCASLSRVPFVEITACREREAQPLLLGAYRPQCEDDGSYSPMQCHGSTGHCWCVNKESGAELEGTRKGPSEAMPDCENTATAPLELSDCQQSASERSGFLGAFVPQCMDDGSYSPMQCHGSTGHCWCVNDEGFELEGTRMHATAGRPDCSKSTALLSSRPPTPCEQQASAPAMPGAYRPQCTEDGAFASMQYHGSTGHRWCVDPTTGVELLGSRRTPTDANPDCSLYSTSKALTSCQVLNARATLIGAYRPQCEDDGSYSPMQCHGSTGHCWCVNKESGAELEGTRKGPSEAMPDCEKAAAESNTNKGSENSDPTVAVTVGVVGAAAMVAGLVVVVSKRKRATTGHNAPSSGYHNADSLA